MARQRMSTWTLGAIMVIVPTSFYLGTALNDHFKQSSDPTHKTAPPAFLSDSPVSATPSEAGSITSNTPRHAAIAQISPEEEQAMLRDKLKKLKTTKMHLEMSLKETKEKLRRVEERKQKELEEQI